MALRKCGDPVAKNCNDCQNRIQDYCHYLPVAVKVTPDHFCVSGFHGRLEYNVKLTKKQTRKILKFSVKGCSFQEIARKAKMEVAVVKAALGFHNLITQEEANSFEEAQWCRI